jgi:hypothetical protein
LLMPPVGDPYLTLMDFKDPSERDKVLGPLFASQAEADAPVFGPEKFTLGSTRVKLDSTVKKLLQSTQDPIIDLLAPAEAGTESELSSLKPSTLPSQLEQLRVKPKISRTSSKKPDPVVSSKMLSSRELHDKFYYTSTSFEPSAEPKSAILDQVMLQRATRGYLFDCEQNMAIVANDPWLQNVWGWVKGKLSTWSYVDSTYLSCS